MKKSLAAVLLISVIAFSELFGQWQKIDDKDIGATGKITAHGSSVFIYGYNSGIKFFRSDDNGASWKDLSGTVPSEFSHLYSYKGELFGVFLGDIYVSGDNGETWTVRSSVKVTGDGAINGVTSDGDNLYLYSNRASIFKSTDDGNTWTEKIIPFDGQVLVLDFAAAGDKWVASAVQIGALVSLDGGKTWAQSNPKYVIGNVHALNGEIYGTTVGVFKLNASGGWDEVTSGLPAATSVKGITSYGNTLYGYVYSPFEGHIYMSDDAGTSWKEAASDFPTKVTTTLNDFITASPSGLYCYLYGLSILAPGLTGTYMAQINTTDVKDLSSNVPADFTLKQNYPNPFNPSTSIEFTIPESSQVLLKVYDASGREVAGLINKNMSAGNYRYDFNALNLASGVYFYRLTAGGMTQTKKMMLLR